MTTLKDNRKYQAMTVADADDLFLHGCLSGRHGKKAAHLRMPPCFQIRKERICAFSPPAVAETAEAAAV